MPFIKSIPKVVKLDPKIKDRSTLINYETLCRWHEAVINWLDSWGTDNKKSRPKIGE